MHHMYKHASYLTVSLQCSRKYKNKQIFNFKLPYEIFFSIINKILTRTGRKHSEQLGSNMHSEWIHPHSFHAGI